MRILFFYSEDIRNRQKPDFVHQEVLHGLGMNFDAEWRFAISRKSADGYICCVSHRKPLPNGIFSHTERNVTISAIVGNNGSGKTSFARMMHRLSLDPKGIRMLLVAQVNEAFYVWGNSIEVEFVSGTEEQTCRECVECLNKKVEEGLTYKDIQNVLKFVYYSPVYTSQHVLDTAKNKDFNAKGSFFYDISTSGLLRHAKNGWREFERQDNWDFWRFISAASLILKYSKEPESILFVRGVRVEIDWESLSQAETYFKECAKPSEGIKRKSAKVKESFLSKLPTLIDAFKNCRLMTAHVIYACAMCSWYGRRICEAEEKLFKRDWLLLEFLDAAKGVSSRNTEASEKIVKGEFDKFWQALSRNPKTRNESGDWCGLYGAFEIDDGPRYSSKEGMCYSFNAFGQDSNLTTIVDCHDKLSRDVDFLKIETRPSISSGEWAIVSIMSRFYGLMDRMPDGSNVILFLDEAETSLHPDWQRSLVSSLVRFLEMGLTWSNFHVIFATHSPIILSDIPSSNVVFLKKKIGKKTFRVYEEDETSIVDASQNTFGANIYDLFKDSFFLANGPVGELAQEKIKKVLEEVARRVARSEDATNHKKYHRRIRLKEWKDILGDKLLVKYITKLNEAGILDLENE